MDNPWHDDSWMRHDGGMMNADGHGGLLTVVVVAVALLALAASAVLTGVVLRARTARTSHPATGAPPPPDQDARRVLEDRLARGEVRPEDYQAIRALLEGSTTPTTSPRSTT